MERVFVSGLGFASCLGNDRATFWKNLTAGQCGLGKLELHDTTDLAVDIGGEVRDLNLDRVNVCLLYTSPSPRDRQKSRMPSSA